MNLKCIDRPKIQRSRQGEGGEVQNDYEITDLFLPVY